MNQNERAAQILIVHEVTKAMDLMQNHYETFCKNNNVKSVPFDYIKTSTMIFKESYVKAANSDDNQGNQEARTE
jgi:hypothetical protein